MAQKIAKRKPIEGVNTEASNKLLKETQARYLLNVERMVNVRGGEGGNEGDLTAAPANRPVEGIDYLLEDGDLCIGAYSSEKRGQVYVWVYNQDGLHTIYRMESDLTTALIYQGRWLNLSADPRHAIRGAYLLWVQGRSYLLWVDGLNGPAFLDVETARRTDSFRHPYFMATDDPGQYLQLPTRPPMTCVRGEWLNIDPDDEVALSLRNFMVDATWQFRTKYIYTDGRASEWSPISSAYYVEQTANQRSAKGLPRTLKLTIPAGHPQVEKVVLAYRNCNGAAYAETNPHDFFQYDVIEKWDDCNGEGDFWLRKIRPDTDTIQYNKADNTFTYLFSGDKDSTPIAVEETNRTQNPCPIVSQAMAVLENRLVLLNNEVGYDPIDCEDTARFEFFATEEDVAQSCTPEIVEVQFSVLIHNIHRQVNQMIFAYGADPKAERKQFGGLMYRGGDNFLFVELTPFDPPAPYLQTFPGTQEGFIGYVEGTDFYAITEQYKWDGSRKKVGTQNNYDRKATRRQLSRELADGRYWMQLGRIKVPKGTKGYIRLAGHNSATSEDYQSTSSTVVGVTSLSAYKSQRELNSGNVDYYRKEVYFDTCTGVVDGLLDMSEQALVVADLTCPSADVAEGWSATAVVGYLRDKNGRPVERAEITTQGSTGNGVHHARITDHNGFYFVSWNLFKSTIYFDYIGLKYWVEGINGERVIGGELQYGKGSLPNNTAERDLIADKVPDYEKKYYTNVRLRVLDCRGVALPQVAVAIAGSKSVRSDSSGWVNLMVRNRAWQLGRTYREKVVVMQSAEVYTLCDTDCDTCMPDYEVSFVHPFSITGGEGYKTEVLRDGAGAVRAVRFNTFRDIFRGLKTGGRYGFAPVFHDATGRHTFIPQEVTYLTLPTVQQKGAYQFSVINYRLAEDLLLPSWVRYLSFYRTPNLAFDHYVQWVVDDVRFVDSEGEDTPAGTAAKIHLSLQSLLDFGAKQAFTNNNHYSFVKGDRVQVLADEMGHFYDPADGILDFLIEGDRNVKKDEVDDSLDRQRYEIIISYDERLRDLKAGALIQLTRAGAADREPLFFELCDTIAVVDGQLKKRSGVLPTFDTYHIRQAVTFDNKLHAATFPFEHHAPSYTWGNHCDDRGRVNVKNLWEKKVHYGGSAYVSDAVLENGNYNGLSTFREGSVKYFKTAKRGDITYAVSFHRTLKILCEQASFTAVVSDDFVRMSRDGVVRAAPADSFIDEQGPVSQYGLAYEDVQAVYFDKSWGMWLDRAQGAVVYDNFQQAVDCTTHNIGSLLREKLAYLRKKTTATFRTTMGFDPVSGNVLLTFFNGTYVHNRYHFDKAEGETFGISVGDHAIFPFSFTPECYGVLRATDKGDVFFAFKEGKAYVHREVDNDRFNEFFGEAVDQVMQLLVNDSPDKVKGLVAMQVQSTTKYYVSEVVTEMSDSNTGRVFMMESEIPPAQVVLREAKWNASFLFNKLTPGVDIPLYNGEAMRGYWASVTLVRDNRLGNSVKAYDNNKRTAYSSLDGVLFTYTLSEQSAFNTP